jgi:hypothetical protein
MQRFGLSLEELSRRFDRGVSWTSRRLGLVTDLPSGVEQLLHDLRIAASVARRARRRLYEGALEGARGGASPGRRAEPP